MHSSRRALFLFPLLCALAGCSTVSEPAGKTAASSLGKPGQSEAAKAVQRFPVEKLHAGLKEADLRREFGEPESYENLAGFEGTAKVWVYRRELRKEVRDTPGGTQLVPAFNGLGANGEGSTVRMVPEAIMRKEMIQVFEVTKILVVNGAYVNHKQQGEETRNFVN